MVLTGVIRKIGLLMLIPVIIGWLLIIVGLALEITNLNASALGSIRYAWWMVIAVVPFMLVAEAVYAIVDKNKLFMSFLGVVVNIFSTLFLTALGYQLGLLGQVALLTTNLKSDLSTELYLQLGGALIAGIFWLILTSLSYFYESDEDNRATSDESHFDMQPLS